MNPSPGLDVVARDQFYRLLLEEYERSERTFVISTHIIEEAASVFEKVLFLDHGSLLLAEDTDTLLSHYAYLSGREEDVRAAAEGRPVLHREQMGRSVTLCVGEADEALSQRCRALDVACDPVPLQKLFVYLAGQKEA